MPTPFPRATRAPRPLTLLVALAGALLAAGAARAQPFGPFAVFDGAPGSYVDVPDAHDLTPTRAFTFEAWVNVSNTGGNPCRSIAGKDQHRGWWIGLCDAGGNLTLRSQLAGDDPRDGGALTRIQWTHVAVVYDGATRKHYVDGELAASFPEAGSLPSTPGTHLRIGSDVEWDFPPTGLLAEVRLWSVARTQAQIRQLINVPVRKPQPGLIAVWGDGIHDAIGAHDGSIVGAVHTETLSAGIGCGTAAPCLLGRFLVTARARAGTVQGPDTNGASVQASTAESLVFSFFGAGNWELLTKAINGCGINHRFWIYSAATTDRFFRLEVLDKAAGAQKIYFNYAGAPAPATTDSDAFATCP
jgi:hypothetical protein